MKESIVKDAGLYTGEDDCYIHVEKNGDGPYRLVVAGGIVCMLQGVYNILSRMETITGVSVKEWIRPLEQGYRKCGTHTTFLTEHYGKDTEPKAENS